MSSCKVCKHSRRGQEAELAALQRKRERVNSDSSFSQKTDIDEAGEKKTSNLASGEDELAAGTAKSAKKSGSSASSVISSLINMARATAQQSKINTSLQSIAGGFDIGGTIPITAPAGSEAETGARSTNTHLSNTTGPGSTSTGGLSSVSRQLKLIRKNEDNVNAIKPPTTTSGSSPEGGSSTTTLKRPPRTAGPLIMKIPKTYGVALPPKPTGKIGSRDMQESVAEQQVESVLPP
eukprot:Filipodium_phascolosomae@DN2938_c0_g1_i1.p2